MKKTLFGFLIFFWLLSWWMQDQLPDQPGYVAGLMNEPVQQKTAREPFSVSAGQENYRVTPRYSYELWGMVVSYHHTDSWKARAHKRWADQLNIKDLCVVWGEANTDPDVYQKIDFSSGEWTCYYRTQDREAYSRFVPAQMSNNHILADNPHIAEAIREASYGDIIHLKGYLSHYQGKKISRDTSTSRDDVGNGACETIYITDFSILHNANKSWEALNSITGYLLLFWLIAVVFLESLAVLRELMGKR